jgi:hypothetical protein
MIGSDNPAAADRVLDAIDAKTRRLVGSYGDSLRNPRNCRYGTSYECSAHLTM